jgi:hypothetical protein
MTSAKEPFAPRACTSLRSNTAQMRPTRTFRALAPPSAQQKAAICGGFARALCRTRTGDPFLTMAVSPGAEACAGSRMPAKRRNFQLAGVRNFAQRSAPALPTEFPGACRTSASTASLQTRLG